MPCTWVGYIPFLRAELLIVVAQKVPVNCHCLSYTLFTKFIFNLFKIVCHHFTLITWNEAVKLNKSPTFAPQLYRINCSTIQLNNVYFLPVHWSPSWKLRISVVLFINFAVRDHEKYYKERLFVWQAAQQKLNWTGHVPKQWVSICEQDVVVQYTMHK